MDNTGQALSAEQQLVLQAVYDWFREHCTWPSFILIDRPTRRTHSLDTRAVLMSLPDSLVVKPWPGVSFGSGDEVRLHLLGIHACQGGREDTDRFVRLLRWLAEQEMAYEPEPGSTQAMPRVTAEEAREHLDLPEDDHGALQRLFVMLWVGNWGLSDGSRGPDGWSVSLSPDIYCFRDVQTVEDCAQIQRRWKVKVQATVPRRHNMVQWYIADNDQDVTDPYITEPPDGAASKRPTAVENPSARQPSSFSYIEARIVAAIQEKEGKSRFDITKLLSLSVELNDNYERKNTYAAHALLRAILDHVSPILDCATFKEVVNNYAWGRTDKRYMKRLLEFRDQADDALHRQISTQADLLNFDDLPSGVCVKRLLQECAEKL